MEEAEQLITKMHNNLLDDVIGVFPAEVKEWGTSAHIPFYKKYAGMKVKILLLKNEDSK